ncbi:hypothetical protein E2C01_079772 [Portunus trituberculatus]|uniref:Uncharacterized protein n=1 Tax=Portunus trituberculatus TaxID=210409 RepID=A0A5B7IXV7_PORTR|nr:hypothetical protein [Portunus trituberculatus]
MVLKRLKQARLVHSRTGNPLSFATAQQNTDINTGRHQRPRYVPVPHNTSCTGNTKSHGSPSAGLSIQLSEGTQ